jgi:tRNA-dihydrouridine synthase B
MSLEEIKPFSEGLNKKIEHFLSFAQGKKLGEIELRSPLVLAPMAGICNIPFRLLMQDLGAGATVSELISSQGILYKNKRTMEMLRIHPLEKRIGLQLFGDDADQLAEAAVIAEAQGASFIDLNMGCPVPKVTQKGGGSAMMKDQANLPKVFSSIIKKTKIPFTIKIRTGWDLTNLNAHEIIHIAKNEGVNWVAIHGRTRSQQYTGHANWEYIEKLNINKELPIIGNGDLHHPITVANRMNYTKCDALMIARGALRNPFIFLESLDHSYANQKKSIFTGPDYWEVIKRLQYYCEGSFNYDRALIVQMRKLIVWFAAGFPGVAPFRGKLFDNQDYQDCMKMTEDYFMGLNDSQKFINYDEVFMSSGHG